MKQILTGLLAAIACSAFAATPIYQDPSQPIEKRIDDALARMTLEEKVALCHAQSKFTSPGVPRLGIPQLMMSDGPHGVRAEINWDDWGYSGWTSDSVTVFPALTALAATWNTDLSAAYGFAIGQEARYREKNVLLGPGVNIYRTPLNGRNFEYMGEDPYLAGEMCVPYIQNLQKNGVAACVKHFALNNQETWRGHIDVHLSDRALNEIYLPAFKKAVQKGGAWSIMGSYNQYNGQHACHNERLLQSILKNDWGFDGCVITDWGGAHDTRQAALYGLDIEMGSYTNGLTSESTFTYDDYYLAKPYLEMLRAGKVPMATVDDKARRVLRLIFRTSMNQSKPFGALCSQEHFDVCRAIGDEAIVLLKNRPTTKRGANILPLDVAQYKRVLVVGDNAVRKLNEGGGSSDLKAKRVVSPLDGIRAAFGDKVTFKQGYQAGKPMYDGEEVVPQSVQDSLRAEAVAAARDADLVIFVGGLNKNSYQDCEATDRREYGLPFSQPQLIQELSAACPATVVVLLSGNAVEMPWLADVPAVLQAWYLGSMAGESIAAVLTGEVNPSGKLPFSFPKRLSDSAAHSFDSLCYPGDSIREVYKEDILVGYRWHDTKKIPALFPFGYGLSYTTFEYSKPTVSSTVISAGNDVSLTFTITNTGTREGKEIAQLYIGDEKASFLRPVKELKGFKKVALKPGESETVTFNVSVDDLKFYDENSSSWVAEPGKFKVYIGSSSTDIKSVTTLTL
jgi:beta-glucosidase